MDTIYIFTVRTSHNDLVPHKNLTHMTDERRKIFGNAVILHEFYYDFMQSISLKFDGLRTRDGRYGGAVLPKTTQ